MRRALLALLIGLCLVWTVPAQAQQRFTQIPVKLQSAAGADGNGSAITVKGYLSVTLQVTGSFTATVNFEGTADGSTWVALKCVNVATDSRVTTVTAAGLVQCNVQGLSSLRARISSWSLGSVTVQGYVMDAVLGSTSGGSGGGGGGDASLAEQQTQTAILTTMDADTGSISTNTSTTATNTGTVAGAVDTTGTDRMRVTMYDSSGNEVVVPTAGLTSYTAAGASTNATSVKASAGTVYGLSLTNTTTTIYYLRMYNTSSAPTCSSATGYVSTIPIPPAAASGGVGGREITKNIGQAFTTGIGFCVTGGPSSTDNTSAATGVFVEILYK